jgi:hypothetical protein
VKTRKEVKTVEKAKFMLDVIQRLLKVAEDLKSLAGSIQEVCEMVSEGLIEEPAEEQVAPAQLSEPKISFEQVRGVLADKSREGHTAKIKEIIRKYGADKLSEVDPENYPAILKEAEELTDE